MTDTNEDIQIRLSNLAGMVTRIAEASSFDKFILKVAGALFVAGVTATVIAFMFFNVGFTRVETKLEYVIQQVEKAALNGYTYKDAQKDKALTQLRFKTLDANMTLLAKRIDRVERIIDENTGNITRDNRDK